MQKLYYFLGLLLCLISLTTARQSLYVQNLKFLPPCENNPIDESTGNFKCMVKTGAECFALCQEHGCFEWSFTSFMASTDTQLHQHYRWRRIGPTLESGSGLGFASIAEAATAFVIVGFTHQSDPCLVPGQLVKKSGYHSERRTGKFLRRSASGAMTTIKSPDCLYTPTATINTDPVYTRHSTLCPLLHHLLFISANYYVHGLKFSRPCENNTYDEMTGNFKCTVPTGAECFQLCQQYGCYEWSFSSFMPSTDTQVRDHFRCRCIQDICLYNYVRVRDRDYA
ncbi:unnamed protein product [Hydatigera taeniaeformis]|uniref:Apple domain-containing protein n=1 Tax=Hydatigena taeniaeformis TaxID=6205 RepID=A0A0R3WML4_HYDTA|nr:unnamed protein product [Hydatigera taeniaeformis]